MHRPDTVFNRGAHREMNPIQKYVIDKVLGESTTGSAPRGGPARAQVRSAGGSAPRGGPARPYDLSPLRSAPRGGPARPYDLSLFRSAPRGGPARRSRSRGAPISPLRSFVHHSKPGKGKHPRIVFKGDKKRCNNCG